MKQWVLAGAVLALGLSACGGGGSGSGSPPAASPPPPPPPVSPPPPPPPANAAPMVDIMSNAPATDEGQVAWIDASTSTDADGDALSFEIRQTGGPSILPVAGETDIDFALSRITFSVPEVSADTDMEFEISVSDGTDTATETFTLTARNIELSPVIPLLGNQYTRFPDSAEEDNVLLGPMTGFTTVYGLLSLKDNQETGTGNIVTSLISRELLSDETFADPERYDLDAPGASQRTVLSTTITRSSSGALLISVEDADEVFVLQWTGGAPAYAVTSEIPVDAPCAVVSAYVEPGITFQSGDLIIGQRGGGIAVYFNQGNDIADTGTFDPPIYLKNSGEYCFISGSSAIDASDGTLHRWERGGSTSGLVELSTIDLELAPNEKIIAFAGSATVWDVEIYAVVVSTGEHDGTHRLILLQETGTGSDAFSRSIRSWTKGLPSDVFILDLDDREGAGFGPYDTVVPLQTAPYAVVVEGVGDPTFGNPTSYGDVTYAALPLGVAMLRPEILPDSVSYGFLGFDSFGDDAGSFLVDNGR